MKELVECVVMPFNEYLTIGILCSEVAKIIPHVEPDILVSDPETASQYFDLFGQFGLDDLGGLTTQLVCTNKDESGKNIFILTPSALDIKKIYVRDICKMPVFFNTRHYPRLVWGVINGVNQLTLLVTLTKTQEKL